MGHLSFRQQTWTGKTAIVAVKSKRGGDDLGEIRWWTPWRRYVFFPSDRCVYDCACLKEITGKIEAMMLERKAASTNMKG